MSVVVLDSYVPPGFILVPVGWISLRIHQTRGSCSHLIVKKYPRRWMRLGLSTLRNSSIAHLVVGRDGHVGVAALVRLAPYPNLRDECSGVRQLCASRIHLGSCRVDKLAHPPNPRFM